MAERDGDSDSIHYWGETPEQEYYRQQGIVGSSSYFTVPETDLRLFTRRWLPPPEKPPKAAIFMVHGYGNDTSWTFQGTPIFLAQHGFACYALDLPSHGRSDGLPAFVPDVHLAARHCLAFFSSVAAAELPRFLFGESMGGAICVLLHFLAPEFFSGAVLVAPMCRISDAIRPPWPIPEVLTAAARVFPTLAAVPGRDLVARSVRVEAKRAVAERNPMRYRGRPRLGTVAELLRVTEWIAARMGDVRLPFLVVHGSADVVTDPGVSRELYDAAESGDKEIKIYDGLMHSLLFGETDENVGLVRKDILAWLNQRS